MNPKSYTDREMKLILWGALDSSAKLYRTSLVVVTKNADIKVQLKQTWGGTIYPSRWVLTSRRKRLALYREWAGWSPYRTAEINAERARLLDTEATND